MATRSTVVVGNRGGTTGTVNVVIKNIPAWLQKGGSTKVLLEKMPAGTAALSAPAVVTNAAAAVTCNLGPFAASAAAALVTRRFLLGIGEAICDEWEEALSKQTKRLRSGS